MKCAKHARETSVVAEPTREFLKRLSQPRRLLPAKRNKRMQQQPQAQPSPTPKPKKKIRVPRVIDGVEQMIEIEVDADSGPGWGPNDKHKLLNQRITRVDGPLKATGVAKYTYDQRLPGMLYARVLRSPHAHARVTKLDTDAASKIPGVKAIIPAPLTDCLLY